jgi:hypothetical protein
MAIETYPNDGIWENRDTENELTLSSIYITQAEAITAGKTQAQAANVEHIIVSRDDVSLTKACGYSKNIPKNRPKSWKQKIMGLFKKTTLTTQPKKSSPKNLTPHPTL